MFDIAVAGDDVSGYDIDIDMNWLVGSSLAMVV